MSERIQGSWKGRKMVFLLKEAKNRGKEDKMHSTPVLLSSQCSKLKLKLNAGNRP
jgi:hypothetical protein